jgi:hypothetical protein
VGEGAGGMVRPLTAALLLFLGLSGLTIAALFWRLLPETRRDWARRWRDERGDIELG